MEAEFDTVAEWTARVAADLGPQFHVPAGCRGSGSPAALDWLIERMGLQPGVRLLDSGAGVGGPAAYAAQSRSVRPVLVEPELGACRAAGKLFGLPVVCADGDKLPWADESFDAAWSLGVLCTTPNQLAVLEELRRVVRPGAAIGLLVFVGRHADARKRLEANHFPTPDELVELTQRSGLRVEHWRGTADLPPIPQDWTRRVEAVEKMLSDRYGHTQTWQLAESQSSAIGELLAEEKVTGELLVLRRP
ncbi:SAM-dependent methyltransferase [Mycobacterium sherrisii]|uniref:SAM-dependent methyltransferase n=2 Tax=Mycobacterium sherrisii TaxID=243061 RepID=A0A1E3T4Y4_9MYCO|nr:class I SAM-dependent methyltransferase [Mycobacterium sherrisii]ODR09424.1 SAM-dependent methyltransferase [Mycobacterium sherrisii]ORW86616.1 SAM-dependent methyltransferase [Mycobacterium sherrisii]